MLYQDRHHECAAWPELKAWLQFLQVGNKSATTMRTYEKHNAKLLLRYPDTPFAEFTDDELLMHVAAYPTKSRPLVKVVANQWFRWGVKTRRITWNPVELLPDISVQKSRDIRVFSEAEEFMLRNLPYPDGQLLTILLETGLRNAEARSLTVKRVDFRAQEILVREGAKGANRGKERFVPLTRAAASAFHELILTEGLNPDDHFWSSRSGGKYGKIRRSEPVSANTLHRWWTRCLEEAGVEYRNPHTTRHSYATRWLDTDIPETDVQDALGHESITTTRNIYQHRDRRKAGERMRAIEAAKLEVEA